MEFLVRKLKTDSRDQKWDLGYLQVVAKTEASKILTEEQYWHVVQLCEQLAYEDHPAKSESLDVRPINDFYELREKGGLLGNINLRIYFSLLVPKGKKRTIVLLKAYKKEDEGKAPPYIVAAVKHRLRHVKEMLEAKNYK